MNKKIFLLSILCAFITNPVYAICVKNKTSSTLYYEIYNKNNGCPIPKETFYSGMLNKGEEKCYAHSPSEGDDWKIYRFDLIKIYKFDPSSGAKENVCNKEVTGILNTLQISYTSGMNHWWCLDDSDYED